MVTTITPTIVNINTTVTYAGAPSQLQQSGALVSVGGTTLTAGTYSYCGSLGAVTLLAATPLAITSLTWASGIVTATIATQTLAVGQTFLTTISGAVPASYNGTYEATVVSATTFTYALSTNPGTETTPGTYTKPDEGFLVDAATTFFAQGTSVGLYILELGPESTATAAITALGTWITANPGVFYAYLVPAEWDSAALNTLALGYNGPSGKTYFFVTTTVSNISNYANNKAVFALVPSPTATATEFQAAGPFYQWLANNPSIAAPAGPMGFRYMYGVTPWSQVGNQASINTVLTAYGNVIYTGAEGGISTATLFRGTTMDGSQAMFWYAVDWLAITAKQSLANAIINGSNTNPPLVYNQNGINSLLLVAQDDALDSVKFGLALSASVTATSFATYVAANPTNYAAGIYNGFACTITPQNGFQSITFNLGATQFA